MHAKTLSSGCEAIQATGRHGRNSGNPAFTSFTVLSIRKCVFSFSIDGVGSFLNQVNSKLDSAEEHQKDLVFKEGFVGDGAGKVE